MKSAKPLLKVNIAISQKDIFMGGYFEGFG